MQPVSNGGDVFLSIIVPMHNAMSKMDAPVQTLQELGRLWASEGPEEFLVEVIFVDDCSTDGTYERLVELTEGEPAWRLLQTASNSGSPSMPRNMGLEVAAGEYVLFLDGDDEINPKGILEACALAQATGYDTIRGPVEIYYKTEGRRVLTDRLNFIDGASKRDKIASIARWQSLICTALWKRSLLIEHGLRFDEESRMGEDIAFTATGLFVANDIGYVDEPLFHYVRYGGDGSSAMHHFDGKKLRELVQSWQRVEDVFQSQGMSYLNLHGASSIGYALRLIIRHHDRESISESDLEVFKDFFVRNSDVIDGLTFSDKHVAEWVSELSNPFASNFDQSVKPRLLIAGHELKFIKPAIPYLRRYFCVRVDEWANERAHDEVQSERLIAWADYVWVEWLTAAAVWYSQRVKPSQELVVRVHRYELGRSYGTEVRDSAVSAYVAIAPHCYEDLIERFNYERNKVKFIPNYYFVDQYEQADSADSERMFNLALIGYVPKRKGLLEALEVLRQLRLHDPRYNLTLFGKNWRDLPWVRDDAEELAYFSACAEFAEAHGLTDSVKTVGWANIYEHARDYGFVLSTSEHEGSHVGPGEAFCAGNIGVFLPWRGAEYVYPEEQVAGSIEDLTDKIVSLSEIERFNRTAQRGRRFMHENYDISIFTERVVRLFRSFA